MELKKLEMALRKSWDRKTCLPQWAEKWSPENHSYGQCAVTALIVQDHFGGRLAVNQRYYHVWNILPDGSSCDLTSEQLPKEEKVNMTEDKVLSRKEFLKGKKSVRERVKERYLLLKKRVDKILKE